MYGVFPIAVPQFGDAINVPGSQTKRYRRVLSIPCTTRSCSVEFPPDVELYNFQNAEPTTIPDGVATCTTMECSVTFPPDVEIYNLQDAGLFNENTIAVTVTCPAGYQCVPGTYPKTFVYPPGTFVMPDPGPGNGFPLVYSLQGCQSTVNRVLPANATAAQISAAIAEIFQAVAEQQAECDALEEFHPNPVPSFTNEVCYASVDCQVGETLTYSGVLPSYLTIDTANNRVVFAAGILAGNTQAEANATAQVFLDGWVDTEFTNGNLSCELPVTFPDFDYLALSGNANELAAATINGENFLAGFPINGTLLGNTITTLWTTVENIPFPGFGMGFQGTSTAGASDAGTYHVEINNTTATVPWFGFHGVEVFLNAVSQYTYDIDTTTGIGFVDIPIVAGDILSFTFGIDGANPGVYTSYQTVITVTKL